MTLFWVAWLSWTEPIAVSDVFVESVSEAANCVPLATGCDPPPGGGGVAVASVPLKLVAPAASETVIATPEAMLVGKSSGNVV